MVGQVPSPTPMIPMFGDSTSVTVKPDFIRPRWRAAITPAASHPAVPPPTITMFWIGRTMFSTNALSPPQYRAKERGRQVCLAALPLQRR